MTFLCYHFLLYQKSKIYETKFICKTVIIGIGYFM